MQVSESQVGPAVTIKATPTVRFSNDAETRLVVVGDGLLSIHMIGDYPGWEEFEERIHEGLRAYTESTEVLSIQRIGIRYINRLEFEGRQIELKDFFTHPPEVPPGSDLAIGDFLLRMEMGVPGRPERVVQTFGSMQAPEGQLAILLDIDVTRDWAREGDSLNTDEAMTHVQNLRDVERRIFEALITEKLRKRFDAA
jgi:uncharacterized protein (TIGR04255 family)